jgi:HEAT repeat protein
VHSFLKPVAEEPDRARKSELLEAIGFALSEPQETIDFLLEATQAKSDDVRFGAFLGLKIAKCWREDVLCAAIRALDDPHASTRDVVNEFLRDAPCASLATARIIEESLHVLGGQYVESWCRALYILGKAKPLPAHAIARIGEALSDANQRVQYAALRAIETLGDGASDLAPTVTGLLSDPDECTRALAASALGCMGTGAIASYPALLARLQDPDSEVQRWAIIGLTKIDPGNPAPIDALRQSLLLSSGDWRLGFATALERLGSKALVAVPSLIQAIQEEERSDVRRALASSTKTILDAYIAVEEKEHPNTDDD